MTATLRLAARADVPGMQRVRHAVKENRLVSRVIPDDEVIMTCIAMGYPNDEFSANAVKSHREPVAQVAKFVGFGG